MSVLRAMFARRARPSDADWGNEYSAAPGRPQGPYIEPRDSIEVRDMAKALKSTGLQLAGPAGCPPGPPGPLTAIVMAAVMLSDLRRRGYDIVRVGKP